MCDSCSACSNLYDPFLYYISYAQLQWLISHIPIESIVFIICGGEKLH
jgi:hypothetical protein